VNSAASRSICSNCNDGDRAATPHALRLDRADGERRRVTLSLCEPCAADILDVEWVNHRTQAADD